jgi:hypothetical protein
VPFSVYGVNYISTITWRNYNDYLEGNSERREPFKSKYDSGTC